MKSIGKPTSYALTLLAACSLGGCATTSGTAAHEQISGFDGARRVEINPHSVDCQGHFVCPDIGARWTSEYPKDAVLVMEVAGAYTSIDGAELNIDGRKVRLRPLDAITQYSNATGALQESTRAFQTDLDLVRAITGSQRTWLRLVTGDGLIERPVTDAGKDSKALNALKRFLSKVDEVPAGS